MGLSIYSWNAETILGNKLPMPFGYGVSVVLSGSMEPELMINDVVIIKETTDVKENDIVVFQENNMMIIHRIIQTDEKTITTKGDANNVEDAPISKNSVKGIMIAKIPKVGSIVQILKQPFVVAMILAAAFVLTEMSYRKEKTKDSEELTEIKKEISELLKELNKDE